MRIDTGAGNSAHVIVLGNEKGGSGKSTTALHIIVALLKAGQRVASIDTDGRQQSLTRYIGNRRLWARRNNLKLELPTHFAVEPAAGSSAEEIEAREVTAFTSAISRVQHQFDFVVIDTPGSNSHLMRLSHSMADTLVTPLNDSFIDFDVLGRVDPETYEVTHLSHYSELVRDARRRRRTVDQVAADWVVVRNRLAVLDSRNKRNVGRGLEALALSLGFRIAPGISERVIFRELFPTGLTALDTLNQATFGSAPTLSHLAARREVRALLDTLRLPLDDRGRRRAEARRIWFEHSVEPIETLDILAD